MRPPFFLFVQTLAKIAVAAVGGYEHDVSAGARSDKLLGCSECRSATEGVIVIDFDDLIHERHVHGVGDKVVADSFDVVVTVFAAAHGRADGVCQHALDVRVLFLEVLEDSRIRAAATCARHHVIYVSVQVVVNFGTSGFVMGKRVRHVAELPERNGARDLRQELFGLLFGAEHSLFARGVDELRPEGAQERLLFLRELGGHHEYHADAAVECREGDAKAGVACGSFNDGSARLERSICESIIYHVKASAVLHAARGVPEFEFSKQVYAFGEPDMVKLYKRSLPD